MRPAFLDLGAVHVTLARWTNLAESVMQRRDGYTNPFRSVFITAHGTVLADIDPTKGVFYSTASTPMGKQFKDLLTTARKSKLAYIAQLKPIFQICTLKRLGTQNMLLDGRIHKSGYNSESTDLVDQAYLRTGLLYCIDSTLYNL